MATKNDLFSLTTKTVDIDGKPYTFKEMSAKDYLIYSDIESEVNEDETISARLKNLYTNALMCSLSLVDDKGKLLLDPNEYKSVIDNIGASLLFKLTSAAMQINGYNDSDEDVAKNS